MAPPTLDSSKYFSMLKRGKALISNDGALPALRIAVLANFSIQQFVPLLRAAVFDCGFFAEVYSAEYDTAALEAYNPDSPLYRFAPDFVFLGIAVQQYRERFLSCRSPEEREQLPDIFCHETIALVSAIRERGISVALTSLALPIEQMFGNFGIHTRQSLYGSVLAVNALLAAAAHGARASLIDVMYLSAVHGSRNFLDERLWVSSKYLCTNPYLPLLAESTARTFSAHKGKVKKCLVLDLDNTLWGGVIGDDGLDGIRIGHSDAVGEAYQLFQQYLLALKHRGYILAVCSKNNDDTARNVFQNHPEMVLREEDIAVFVANWNDKAANIEYIAKTLNIGIDSLVFIDDSPFERNLVRSLLPAVAVPELPEDVSDYIAAIEESGVLESTGYSQEDFNRNQMYREEALRGNEEMKFSNLDEYLQSLEICVDAGSFTKEELPRIAQLLQRSNQFNLRTQRFDELACEKFMSAPERYFTFRARLRDRFGDYGLVAIICGEKVEGVLNITELVMSCRVLKRGMEEFMINKIFEYCREHQLRGVRGEYIPSPKNAMVKDFYPLYGFIAESVETPRVWYLDTDSFSTLKTFVREDDK